MKKTQKKLGAPHKTVAQFAPFLPPPPPSERARRARGERIAQIRQVVTEWNGLNAEYSRLFHEMCAPPPGKRREDIQKRQEEILKVLAYPGQLFFERLPDDTTVNPAHYQHGHIEPIDVIQDWALSFAAGNAVKYLARYRHAGHPINDLRKAKRYIELEIADLEARAALGRAATQVPS